MTKTMAAPKPPMGLGTATGGGPAGALPTTAITIPATARAISALTSIVTRATWPPVLARTPRALSRVRARMSPMATPARAAALIGTIWAI